MAAIEHGRLLAVDKAYWFDWEFNGQVLEDCKDQNLIYVLNYLGQDEWEFAGMVGKEEYILKRK